jgi:hypothetical protein
LNGQTVLFVARISGLAEKAIGWQAFFVRFFEIFLTVWNRGLRGYVVSGPD